MKNIFGFQGSKYMEVFVIPTLWIRTFLDCNTGQEETKNRTRFVFADTLFLKKRFKCSQFVGSD